MTRRNIYITVCTLVSLIIMIFVLNWSYQSLKLSVRGFPLFSSFLDVDKWRMNEENLSAGKLDYAEESQIVRQSMVNDLVSHNKNIYLKRNTLLATLGKPLKPELYLSLSDKISFALLYNKSKENVLNSINSRTEKKYDMSGLCITKDDVIYIAGRSYSGACVLIFFYDESGTLIDCAWLEQQ